MNWLDILIVLFLLATVFRGSEVGFIRQFFSTLGFVSGLILAAWLESSFIHLLHTPHSRALAAFCLTLGLSLVLMSLGEYAGLRLKFKLRLKSFLDKADRIMGGTLAVVTLLAGVWLAASIFRSVPDAGLRRQISTSKIVGLLDKNLPPAPGILTKLGTLIQPNSFPQVFTGWEPQLRKAAPLPDLGIWAAAIEKDRASIVQVEGTGCGGIVEGSGFVSALGEVVTNAHVVAGVRAPYVLDDSGKHRATVVWFDPELDLALLRVPSLNDQPLALNTETAANNTPAAVAGYPGGGSFNVVSGTIIETFTALGRNIYNSGHTSRQVYSVSADIEEGNSGGPLLATDGSVLGMVFAKSTSYDKVGYALTAKQVSPSLATAHGKTAAVSTGSCTQ